MDKPWLTQEANKILERDLKSNFNVLEYGSGRSTVFFAKRCHKVYSIENNESWYRRVLELLEKNELKNAELSLLEGEDYYNKVKEFDDEFFDIILIDGVYRAECVVNSLPKVKKNGTIIW